MVELDIKPQVSKRDVTPEHIRSVLSRHEKLRGSLIATLEEVQAEYGYLPEKALRIIADETGKSLTDIYGIASFYHAFSLKPRGEHLVSLCLGTACHVRGAPRIVAEFEKQLDIKVGETTEDSKFTLRTVNCLGACALGPVAIVDGRYHSKLKRTNTTELLDGAVNGFEESEGAEEKRVFSIDVSCPFCNHSLMDDSFYIEGRPSIRVTVSFGQNHGWVRLSSLYGRYDVFSEHEIPFDTVVNFFCPHCHAELIGSWECAMCGAPMVPMIVRGGGTIRICSRRGCCGSKSHMLDLI